MLNQFMSKTVVLTCVLTLGVPVQNRAFADTFDSNPAMITQGDAADAGPRRCTQTRAQAARQAGGGSGRRSTGRGGVCSPAD